MSAGGPPRLEFVPDKNPVHRIAEPVRQRLVRAQQEHISKQFPDARDLLAFVLDELKLSVAAPADLGGQPVGALADLDASALTGYLCQVFESSSVPASAARLHALAAAERLYLVRAFADPTRTVVRIAEKVARVVAQFPRSAADIERGRNPGDVLDPYILAATRGLLHGGGLKPAVATTVAHKALMIIEGLLGHLHEEVIGEMRGNLRVPEPRGVHQEMLDLETNPFPGADIVQPPHGPGGALRFHQVKSKTGSAKGGDGARLGTQLQRLRDYYGGELYFDALIGSTLSGHRSRAGVERTAPSVTFLVGEAAFRELTGSRVGAELLLRVYQAAFAKVAEQTGYRVEAMTEVIVTAFEKRAAHEGETIMESVLAAAVRGRPEDQDSRLQKARAGRRLLR